MNSRFILTFHKAVKYLQPTSMQQTGEHNLNQNISPENRSELEAKMATVFKEEITKLSTELQEILLDDMVTAFESRLNVLKRVRVGIGF